MLPYQQWSFIYLFIYSFIYLSIDLFFSIQLTTIYRRRPRYQLKQWLWKLHFYNYSQTAQGPMNLNGSFSQLPRALYATSRCGWSFYNDPRLNLLLIFFTRRLSILHIWGIWTTQLVLGTCCHGYELSWVRVVLQPFWARCFQSDFRPPDLRFTTMGERILCLYLIFSSMSQLNDICFHLMASSWMPPIKFPGGLSTGRHPDLPGWAVHNTHTLP